MYSQPLSVCEHLVYFLDYFSIKASTIIKMSTTSLLLITVDPRVSGVVINDCKQIVGSLKKKDKKRACNITVNRLKIF